MITQERLKELLDYNPDTGEFVSKVPRGRSRKGCVVGCPDVNGYTRISIDRMKYKAHRLAFLYMKGTFPRKGLEIDHINRVRNDNRWNNLRLVTHKENMQNSALRVDNASGYRGVTFNKGACKWKAYITLENKQKHLGYFPTKEEAIEARLKAEKELNWLTTEKDNV